MTINKYQGKTKEEAVEKAKQELGEGAVVLNVKEIKPKGMLKMFKSSVFEVTAAMEEKEKFTSPTPTKKPSEGISLAADEKITIPKPVSKPSVEERTEVRREIVNNNIEMTENKS